MNTTIGKDEKIEYQQLVELPLYSKLIFEPFKMGSAMSGASFNKWSNHSESINLLNEPSSKFKAYCKKCKEDRIFVLADKASVDENWRKSNAGGFVMFYDGIRYHEFECSLNQQHRINFTYKVGKDFVMKIGQFPSSADLQKIPKDYSTLLPEDRILEFKRAIRLNSFGVGIGSYVYLRRIIEFLIIEGHKKAKTQQDWNDQEYLSGDTKERIKLLKGILPDFLIDNNLIYGILSKGIHELNEQVCIKYFPVLKNSIELILDEQLEIQRKKEKSDLLNKALNSINSDINN